jgi:hypothetical protein
MKIKHFSLETNTDINKMTDDEFFAFLDSETKRIRQENVIVPLTEKQIRFAKQQTENIINQSNNN